MKIEVLRLPYLVETQLEVVATVEAASALGAAAADLGAFGSAPQKTGLAQGTPPLVEDQLPRTECAA